MNDYLISSIKSVAVLTILISVNSYSQSAFNSLDFGIFDQSLGSKSLFTRNTPAKKPYSFKDNTKKVNYLELEEWEKVRFRAKRRLVSSFILRGVSWGAIFLMLGFANDAPPAFTITPTLTAWGISNYLLVSSLILYNKSRKLKVESWKSQFTFNSSIFRVNISYCY